MQGVEFPSFKEFREEGIVCKSIKFRLADEMQPSGDGIHVHRSIRITSGNRKH